MKQLRVLVLSEASDMLIYNIESSLTPNNDFTFHTKGEIDDFDIILIKYSYFCERIQLFDKNKLSKNNIAFLVNFTDNALLDKILAELYPYHLIGLSDINAISDIKDFLFSFSQNKKWTAENLIGEINNNKTLQVVDSLGYQEKITDMISTFTLNNCFDGFEAYLNQVINELLTNALFNAPVNQSGVFLYRDKDRAEKISMLPGKEVLFKALENDKKIIISIKDRYGSLKKTDIDKHINNSQILDKSGGAGVGIYTSFRYCHKLIFNVTQGESTDVVIVFNKLKRNKQYSLIDKSFHFFEN